MTVLHSSAHIMGEGSFLNLHICFIESKYVSSLITQPKEAKFLDKWLSSTFHSLHISIFQQFNVGFIKQLAVLWVALQEDIVCHSFHTFNMHLFTDYVNIICEKILSFETRWKSSQTPNGLSVTVTWRAVERGSKFLIQIKLFNGKRVFIPCQDSKLSNCRLHCFIFSRTFERCISVVVYRHSATE